jgi:hypothetical protein
MIREMRGIQWDKWEIRVLGSVWVHRAEKRLKNIGIPTTREKKRIQ